MMLPMVFRSRGALWCRTIEMRYLTIETCHSLIHGKWQTDAFPGVVGRDGVGIRLACVPGTFGDMECFWHAEVIVQTYFPFAVSAVGCAFHEVKQWGSGGAIIHSDVMTADESLRSALFIFQRIVHYGASTVSIVRIIAVCIGIDEEVLADAVLDCESMENGSIVIIGREVYGSGGRNMYVGVHIFCALRVSIIMEVVNFGAAIISFGAIDTVCHEAILMRSNLRSPVSRNVLQ